jgi:hypothetical protein
LTASTPTENKAPLVASRFIDPFIAFQWVLIAALWLSTRPYRGIYHDARLYAFQAISSLKPTVFDDDLFIKYGSQDAFSIFSLFYKALISQFGLSFVYVSLLVAGQILWVAALVFLVRSVLPNRKYYLLAIAFAIALPGFYGSRLVFSYGELFLTPRLLAEALVMGGLGFVLRRKMITGFGTIVIGAMIHPLMAAAGFGTACIHGALRDLRWLWIMVGVAVICSGLVFIGIEPFGRLRETFDPHWLEIVRQRSPHTFITQWSDFDFAQLVTTLAFAMTVLVVAGKVMRQFILITIGIGLGGVVISLIGGDIAHNKLILNAQPWRALWLTTLAANIGAVHVFQRILAGEPGKRPLWGMIWLVGLLALLAARVSPAFYFATAVIFIFSLPGLYLEITQKKPIRGYLERLALAVAILLSFGAAALVGGALHGFEWFVPSVLNVLLIIASIAAMTHVLMRNERYKSPRLFQAAALIILATAILTWDKRENWEKWASSTGITAQDPTKLLPEKSSVYWENGLELLWFKFGRPSYFSCDQGAGAMFFRSTAIEYQRRLKSLRKLQTEDSKQVQRRRGLCPQFKAAGQQPPNEETLKDVCRQERQLDYLVLTNPINKAYFATWRPSISIKVNPKHTVGRFYFYRCADFRG